MITNFREPMSALEAENDRLVLDAIQRLAAHGHPFGMATAIAEAGLYMRDASGWFNRHPNCFTAYNEAQQRARVTI